MLRAYETALLSEVAEAGADEVILLDADGLFSAESEDVISASDAVWELTDVARAVNARSPETVVGIAFAPAFLGSADSDRHLGSIAEAFDLLLLDLRGSADAEDVHTAVASGVAEHLYFILRYKMRVLIPAGTADAVTGEAVNSWQEGSPDPALNAEG